MATTDLHYRFIQFAEGMPAVAFGRDQLQRELQAVVAQLAGTYPNSPTAAMANIPMPSYNLAYSVFLDALQANIGGSVATLAVDLRATIHLRDAPDQVIRSYTIATQNPIQLTFEYDQRTRVLYWRQQGIAVPTVTPSWGPNADAVLAQTTIPVPQRDAFIAEVEQPSLFSTNNMFVTLLLSLLPAYKIGEIVPWLTLLEPLRFDFQGEHILVTASRAQLAVGGCNPHTITVEPDPAFPYGQPIPQPTSSARAVDIAVYLPKTRFIDFTASVLEPAVLVSDSGGGVVKWAVGGSFGLKGITADIATDMQFGGANGTVTGVIGLGADIDFVGAGKAWIDGPSGLHIGLASADVLGNGDFAAAIRLTVDIAAGYVYGDLVVTQASLTNVDFDVSTPLPWPLNEVAALILDAVARDETRKLVGQVTHLGRWDYMGIPLSYSDTVGGVVVPVMEGLASVSAYVGVGRRLG